MSHSGTNANAHALFWKALHEMGHGAAPWSDWEWYLGDMMPWLERFLRPTIECAETLACPANPSCGCRHVVRETSSGFIAVCTCEQLHDCLSPLHSVQAVDLVLHRLDLRELALAAGKALGLEEPVRAAASPVAQVTVAGVYGPARLGVWLHGGRTGAIEFSRIAERVGEGGPVILLTTSSELPAKARPGDKCRVIWIGSVLSPGAGGRLVSTGTFGAAVDDWLKELERHPPSDVLKGISRQIASLRTELAAVADSREALTDDTARQVFAVLKQMDTTGRGSCQKAPLTQVFRLYCLENLSAREVANRCKCAKSLVIKRLRELECKLGRKPAALRVISGQFEALETSLSDSRARRIYRPSAVYGTADEEEE